MIYFSMIIMVIRRIFIVYPRAVAQSARVFMCGYADMCGGGVFEICTMHINMFGVQCM